MPYVISPTYELPLSTLLRVTAQLNSLSKTIRFAIT